MAAPLRYVHRMRRHPKPPSVPLGDRGCRASDPAVVKSNAIPRRKRASTLQRAWPACLALLALAQGAWARELFVSTDGSDDRGNGSADKPYRTIAHAVDASDAGDTVTVRGPASNRVYNECDVRLRHRLVLRAYPGEQPHIHCDLKVADSVVIEIDPEASGSRVAGFELSGGMYYGVMLQTWWYQGGPDSDTGATDVVLEDLLIHDTGRDGIKVTPKSNNATIRRVEIHHTGAIYPPGTPVDDKNADGIDNVNGSGMRVEDSYIHHTATTGLYFKGGAEDVLIQRNRIEDAGEAGILVGFDTSVEYFDLKRNPDYYEAIRGTVRNNVIRRTQYSGIGLYAAKDAVVANNTIIDAAKAGHGALYFGVTFQDWDPKAGRPPSVNPKLLNNLVFGAAGRCLEVRYSNELGGLSALEGAPGSDYNGYAGGCRFLDMRTGRKGAVPSVIAALPMAGVDFAQWRADGGADAHSVMGDFRVDARGRPLAGGAQPPTGTEEADVQDDFSGQPRGGAPTIGAWQRPAAGALALAAGVVAPAIAPPALAAPAGSLAAGAPAWGLWLVLVGLPLALLLLAGTAFVRLLRRRNIAGWLLAWLRQDWRAPVPAGTTRHLLFCFVDHYEPAWGKPGLDIERRRVARWHRDLPRLCEGHRDADGRQPVHSFFYPEEEYREEHLDALVDLCRQGLGEIEIHLHHDDDTEAGLREKLSRFTELLAARHDALPRDPHTGQPRWAFIHGNWALDNSHPSGRHCGVDNELIVLREEGCYADFTLPAAPDPCQTRTINRIYYGKDDPARPKSHDTGPRVRAGGSQDGDLMIIQGPLGFRWRSRKFGLIPRIENSDIRTVSPPSPDRIDAWVETGIHVEGRPEWTFVKIHTHGTEEEDIDTLLGRAMHQAYGYLEERYNDGTDWKLHYVSAREMYNIAKAAEAGETGDPGQYRDYLIPRPAYRKASERAAA